LFVALVCYIGYIYQNLRLPGVFIMILPAEISAEPVLGIAAGLAVVALIALIAPFLVKFVEHNLELFFLVMGAVAVTISGLWSGDLVIEALKAPVMIGHLPIGIFQVVLVVGLLIYFFNYQFQTAVAYLVNKMNMRVFIFLLIFLSGLLSSVISVILAAVLLAEIAPCLPLSRNDCIKLVVVCCYAFGLGAVLTPLGEPLSTILVQKLAGAPFFAGFTWPFEHFGIYVIPGVLAIAIFGTIWIGKKGTGICEVKKERGESIRSVIIRAVKVFIFVAALVLLGEGLKPLVIWFFAKISAMVLYWLNIVSAMLDNATLTAIEINADMTLPQIVSIIMGLLIAGGMLIPGNIPNIVAAGKLKISMREWAVFGIPIGLVLMVIYFLVLLPLDI
jgi:predicted cation transporter